ncbi:MAG: hypothetical protein IT318_24815 [Anaerolineales bacterium]|nr:hypothetical protein [Anaerolineales bacterium]
MYPNNLSAGAQVRTGLDYASGSADRNGAVFDMAGFEGVLMIFKMAAIAAGAVTSIKAQQGQASNLSDAADLAGTAQTVADDDDNQIFIIDLYRPTERYVRGVVDKDAVNATAETLTYIGYGARELPVTQTLADAVTFERHISPAEGTA